MPQGHFCCVKAAKTGARQPFDWWAALVGMSESVWDAATSGNSPMMQRLRWLQP
jgi:hypothetical protein